MRAEIPSSDVLSGAGYRLYRHRPWRRVLWFLSIFLVSGVATYSAYKTGERDGAARGAKMLGVKPLQERLSTLQTQNSALGARLERLQRTAELDQKAAAEVSRSLGEMEEKLLELNEELSFYKTIVSPSTLEAGLHVQDFRIEPGDAEREFSYKLVLTQIRSNHRIAAGAVNMVVEGKRGSKTVNLPLEEMSAHESDKISFNFKYFQNVAGTFLLPAGFKPTKVKLRVQPSSQWLKGIERAYRWTDVLERA
jgi:hypothetical protein